MEKTKYVLKSTTEICSIKMQISDIDIKKYINEIYRLGDSMNRETNVKASMTSYQIFNETKIFDKLLEDILKTCDTLHEVDKRRKLTLPQAWGIVYKNNESSDIHHHLPATYSFTYYLNDSKTPIIFPEADFIYTARKNELLFFPGHLKHYVPEHKGIDRIVLAGNFIFKDR